MAAVLASGGNGKNNRNGAIMKNADAGRSASVVMKTPSSGSMAGGQRGNRMAKIIMASMANKENNQ
jgi:hypothetical protein